MLTAAKGGQNKRNEKISVKEQLRLAHFRLRARAPPGISACACRGIFLLVCLLINNEMPPYPGLRVCHRLDFKL